MAKQSKNTDKDVATDQNLTHEVTGTIQPETKTDQPDSQEMQAPTVPTASDESGSVASGDGEQGNSDSASTSGGENSEMDTQTENEGTGEQGGNAENIEMYNNEEEAREFVRDIVLDELSRALTMAQANVDEPIDEPKADTEKRLRIARDIFKPNDRCEVLYFTSDFIPFFYESDAVRHTRNLADKTIITITKQ